MSSEKDVQVTATDVEIIRMAGHLLEHNPATKTTEVTIAGRRCYCAIGALGVCSDELRGAVDIREPRNYLFDVIIAKVRRMILSISEQPFRSIIHAWEGPGTSVATRLAFAKALQNYHE